MSNLGNGFWPPNSSPPQPIRKIHIDRNLPPIDVRKDYKFRGLMPGSKVRFWYSPFEQVDAKVLSIDPVTLEIEFDMKIDHVYGVKKSSACILSQVNQPKSKGRGISLKHWTCGRNYHKKSIIKLYYRVKNMYGQDDTSVNEYLSPSQREKIRQAAALIQEVLDDWRAEHKDARRDAFPDL